MSEAKPDRITNCHRLSDKELLEALKTKLSTGLTEKEVEERRAIYGENKLEEEEKETFWDKIKEQFEDRMVRLLLLAAVISFVVSFFGNWLLI